MLSFMLDWTLSGWRRSNSWCSCSQVPAQSLREDLQVPLGAGWQVSVIIIHPFTKIPYPLYSPSWQSLTCIFVYTIYHADRFLFRSLSFTLMPPTPSTSLSTVKEPGDIPNSTPLPSHRQATPSSPSPQPLCQPCR